MASPARPNFEVHSARRFITPVAVWFQTKGFEAGEKCWVPHPDNSYHVEVTGETRGEGKDVSRVSMLV